MAVSPQPRAELATFLRTRREHVDPTAVGLSPVGPRRTPGLRREEVSLLSGVSLTWYTWLEQGRDITPSRQVIDPLARTLLLSAAEHEYVLRLVDTARRVAGIDAKRATVEDAVRELTRRHERRELLELGGIEWEGDLDASRRG